MGKLFFLISLISFFSELLAELLCANKIYRWSVVVCKVLHRKGNCPLGKTENLRCKKVISMPVILSQ